MLRRIPWKHLASSHRNPASRPEIVHFTRRAARQMTDLSPPTFWKNLGKGRARTLSGELRSSKSLQQEPNLRSPSRGAVPDEPVPCPPAELFFSYRMQHHARGIAG